MDLPKNQGNNGRMHADDLIIHLIKAELKNRKFTRALEEVGFDTTFYSLDFSALILDLLGFEDRSDETFEMYHQLLENHIEEMDLKHEDESVDRLAKSFLRSLQKQR